MSVIAGHHGDVIVGRVDNVGWIVDGDQLTIALIVNKPGGPPGPRFTFTLCPRKLHAWRLQSRTTASIPTARAAAPRARARSTPAPRPSTPPPTSRPTPAPPLDPEILRLTGLPMPLGACRLWLLP